MYDIYQAEKFEEIKNILTMFYKENNFPEDKIQERVNAQEDIFNKENLVFYILTVDNIAKGLMTIDIEKSCIRSSFFYIVKNENYDELVYALIANVTKQSEEFKKEYLQIYNVQCLNIKEKLRKNGFRVQERVKMIYDLKGNQIQELKLASGYQEGKFVLEKLDEELQVIVDANKGTLDGSIFLQFSTLEKLKAFFLKSGMDSERLRNDSPILLKDGKVIGVNIVASFKEKSAYIWIIALLPEHQGKGLGKYLMVKSHENCKNANVEEMVLDVTVENLSAYNLYKKLGYKETDRYLTIVKKYNE